MKKSGLLFIMFILSGCTAKYDVIRYDNTQLSINDSYYISNPKDGKYAEINYVNSGEMTRDALFNELSTLGVKTEKADKTLSKIDSLLSAKQQGYVFLIYPTILHWEDRATEWSGLRDRAKIKLELIDTDTKVTVDNAIFNLVGTWWTFGGLHPQDMVSEAVKEYFKKVFDLEK
ncbi:conserved hypothetical protein [Bathymodiolus platifrons methanotrophic gill symbiont]|uniref:DUF4823 domain-containing protein n=1 Tax=Bathymodiolus platifrons methanotrophic gill symbiont TaxID=113268 RepID=UPI000B40F472|nr:DUF4823 domain-containing protein [Bathymodiolus platifrons methanotrophic gill symbiont]GAW87913.1 conserved hypothetical protein [Bathymodiolus platifrons methanotrophic gill symbiont]